MTRAELVALGSHKVRRSETLMAFYLKEFEALFNRKPKCAGCTFNSDWRKFEKGINVVKQIKITTKMKTFELNHKGKNVTHTYRDGNRPIRSYAHNMTQDFAINYLTIGTKEQIEERKNYFSILPNLEEEKAVKTILLDGEEINLEDATGKEMNAYAKENDIDFGDATKVAEKREVISKLIG